MFVSVSFFRFFFSIRNDPKRSENDPKLSENDLNLTENDPKSSEKVLKPLNFEITKNHASQKHKLFLLRSMEPLP